VADDSAKSSTLEEGLQAVEILHIDTVNSQEFFQRAKANPAEKQASQTILFDMFSDACRQEGGAPANNWAGDGGHAFFSAREANGRSVRAARRFLANLPILAQQTATALGHGAKLELAVRRFRIKAHFGLVRLTADGRFDAGRPEDFDAFLKHEKLLAPIPNELFITQQLLEQLGATERNLFREYKKVEDYGALRTSLHRLTTTPSHHGRNVLTAELQPGDIKPAEWRYLCSQIRAQRMNVAARNSITIGLMKELAASPGSGLKSEALLRLTLQVLFRYLRSIYPDQRFKATFWRRRDNVLDKVAAYPLGGQPMVPRQVSLNDRRFAVVRSYRSRTEVVTESVNESRLMNEWVDFDTSQQDPSRGLESSFQVPVYWSQNDIEDDFEDKELLGALSIDCDRPDFFLKAEVDVWTDDLVGFLANLALAEHIWRAEQRGPSHERVV
jgi:hypothetical protein